MLTRSSRSTPTYLLAIIYLFLWVFVPFRQGFAVGPDASPGRSFTQPRTYERIDPGILKALTTKKKPLLDSFYNYLNDKIKKIQFEKNMIPTQATPKSPTRLKRLLCLLDHDNLIFSPARAKDLTPARPKNSPHCAPLLIVPQMRLMIPARKSDPYPNGDHSVSKKKNKFDLTDLVHHGLLKEGQTLVYVSDPSKKVTIVKLPNGEFKVKLGAEITTVHAFAQKCLGEDPPDHASKWIRTEAGKTLYELWHAHDQEDQAA